MRKLIPILLIVLLFAGCAEDVSYDNPLSLSARRNELSAKGGSVPVIVFANGKWTAHLPENCVWASLEKAEGNGLGEFVFNFDGNSDAARKVVVTVYSEGSVSRIEMAQKSGLEGGLALTFPYGSVKASKCAGRAAIPFVSNIPETEMSKVTVSAANQNGSAADWIEKLTVFADRLNFDLAENNSGKVRKATISFKYADDFGEELSKNISVEQSTSNPYVKYDSKVTSSMFPSASAKITIPFDTNLGLFLPQLLGSASSNQDWAVIEKGTDLKQELVVGLAANEGGDRVAKLSMSYTDAAGTIFNFDCLIAQEAYMETEEK
ncbi:MAG: BACON domain-containing protein [Candidatus Cryptobacteroides sp.]